MMVLCMMWYLEVVSLRLRCVVDLHRERASRHSLTHVKNIKGAHIDEKQNALCFDTHTERERERERHTYYGNGKGKDSTPQVLNGSSDISLNIVTPSRTKRGQFSKYS